MPIRTYIEWSNFSLYREVRSITYKDGKVYKTKHVKFVKADYTPNKDELVSSLSTSKIGNFIFVE